jgi:hypothetical protein
MRLSVQSPSVVAVYLTVPTQFVHLGALIEWANLRRKMSRATICRALNFLCHCGLIERKSGGYYPQQTAAPVTRPPSTINYQLSTN